jgi:hypothetical protein
MMTTASGCTARRAPCGREASDIGCKKIFTRDNCYNARHVSRARDVQGFDHAMRNGGPHEGHLEMAAASDIRNIAAPAGQESEVRPPR